MPWRHHGVYANSITDYMCQFKATRDQAGEAILKRKRAAPVGAARKVRSAIIRPSEACPFPSLSACPAVLAFPVAVDVEAAAGVPPGGAAALGAQAVAGAPLAAGAAADAPAAGAAARAAAPGYAFVPSPGAGVVAAAAFVVFAARPPFAVPRAGVLGSAAVRRAGAPGPVACASSQAVVDVAARAADCRSAGGYSMAEPTKADRCADSTGRCWAADSAAH